MKISLRTLMILSLFSKIFVATNVLAEQMSVDELFAALNGEFDYAEDDVLHTLPHTHKMIDSFDEFTALMNHILFFLDGEYDSSDIEMSLVNSSQSSLDSESDLDDILSKIDGEYEYE